MKSKKNQSLSSSHANQALLQSTDTFNSRQLNSSSSDFQNHSDVVITRDTSLPVPSAKKRKKFHLKPLLVITTFFTLLAAIITILLVLDSYAVSHSSKRSVPPASGEFVLNQSHAHTPTPSATATTAAAAAAASSSEVHSSSSISSSPTTANQTSDVTTPITTTTTTTTTINNDNDDSWPTIVDELTPVASDDTAVDTGDDSVAAAAAAAAAPASDTDAAEFTWNHCGQTYVKPSIDPKSLVRKMSKRIVGGEDAVDHSWPFLVSIRLKLNRSEHHCGGTLITDQYVITAAHCFIAYFRLLDRLSLNISQIFSLMEVQVGLNEHESDAQYLTSEHVYSVEYFDIHENFNFDEWTLVNDIAILKLKRRVNLRRPEVNVICLPSSRNVSVYRMRNGENVVALGWGAYAEEYDYAAYVRDHLQQAVFTIRDQHDKLCNSGMIGKRWDKNLTICADGKDKKMVTCYGDSGGPVLAHRNNRWTLIGIISFGHDVKDYATNQRKCNASMPFYFVKVKAYFEWINKKTNYTLNTADNNL